MVAEYQALEFLGYEQSGLLAREQLKLEECNHSLQKVLRLL